MHTSLEAIVKFALPPAPSKYLSFDYQPVATFTLHVRRFRVWMQSGYQSFLRRHKLLGVTSQQYSSV